jgi:hypothetical protein
MFWRAINNGLLLFDLARALHWTDSVVNAHESEGYQVNTEFALCVFFLASPTLIFIGRRKYPEFPILRFAPCSTPCCINSVAFMAFLCVSPTRPGSTQRPQRICESELGDNALVETFVVGLLCMMIWKDWFFHSFRVSTEYGVDDKIQSEIQ